MLNAPNSSVLVQPAYSGSSTYAAPTNFSMPLPGSPGNFIFAPNSNITINNYGPPIGSAPSSSPLATDAFSPSSNLYSPMAGAYDTTAQPNNASAYLQPASTYPPTQPICTQPSPTQPIGGYPGYPITIPPSQTIAGNQTSKMWGDPHIVSANGGKYDFQQLGTYNLLQDTGINLNANLTGTGVPGQPTYITEAGLTLPNAQLDVKTDGTATLNDGQSTLTLQDGQSIQLADGSTITKKGNIITATTPEYNIKIDASNPEKVTTPHLNIAVDSGANGVMSDGIAPSGLLGETFSAGTQAQTAPDLDTGTYQRSGLFDASTNAATEALAQQQLINAGGQIIDPSTIQNPPVPTIPTTPSTSLTSLMQLMAVMSGILQILQQLMGQSSGVNTTAA